MPLVLASSVSSICVAIRRRRLHNVVGRHHQVLIHGRSLPGRLRRGSDGSRWQQLLQRSKFESEFVVAILLIVLIVIHFLLLF